ncbi:MAG: hypothetical protein V4597_08250 [Pseudomonadota bacterium]
MAEPSQTPAGEALPAPTITVLYTCAGCGLARQPVTLKARTPRQGPAQWMDQLALAISLDHVHRSPGCKARTMQDVLVPMHGRPVLGGPTVS